MYLYTLHLRCKLYTHYYIKSNKQLKRHHEITVYNNSNAFVTIKKYIPGIHRAKEKLPHDF